MNTTTKTTAAAVALIAALLLTGCSGTDVFSGASKAAAESTATAAPTPEPIDGDENGDGKLSEREKELIAKRSYTLLDGTVVPTPKQGEAIPEAIIENIRAQGVGFVADMSASASSNADIDLMEMVAAEQKRIGRTIIMVTSGIDGTCGCLTWQVWTLQGPVIDPVPSKDAAVSAASAKATTNAKYQVIVFD